MYQSPIVIERALTQNGELQLQKRGKDFEIIFNGTFLMATYNGESEKLLVQWAVERADSPKTILIAGLGVGFSLAEAQKYKTIDKITVVEIEQKIIEWNKRYLSTFSEGALIQPKVDVVHGDFIEWVNTVHQKYDVICLDIDNGPDWVVLENNNELYSSRGICNLLKIMSKGGAVSFWSASKSRSFEALLRKYFNGVCVKEVAHQSGKPDYIYLAFSPK
ncbi:MAG: spermine/spermidine synthase [Thermoanaerobacteraceae bacterium]|nr:spermine/spermidine synthase [Thermoanaerobacteraceae bacterium]